MKILTIIGIILIVLGAVGLIYGGITYTTSKDIIDMGSMHIQVDQKNQILQSPIASVAAIVIGVILIIVERRRKSS